MFEEAMSTARAQVTLGEPLDGLSIGELEERSAQLRAEISRVQDVLARKQAGRAAAEAVFGKAS